MPIFWMRKQTKRSISSAESNVISLDAALRMEGIRALQLWGLRFGTAPHLSAGGNSCVRTASVILSLTITCHSMWSTSECSVSMGCFPSRLCMMMNGRSPSRDMFLPPIVLTQIGFLKESIWKIQFPSGTFAPQGNQLADISIFMCYHN